MGGLRKKMPVTFLTFFIATLAIAGIPFTSGFYSKDMIVRDTLLFSMISGGSHRILFVIAAVTAGMTAFYMFRLNYLTFFGNRVTMTVIIMPMNRRLIMTVPLAILAVLAIVSGYGHWFEKKIHKPTLSQYVQTTQHSTTTKSFPGGAKRLLKTLRRIPEATASAHSAVSASAGDHSSAQEQHLEHRAHQMTMRTVLPLVFLASSSQPLFTIGDISRRRKLPRHSNHFIRFYGTNII